MCASFHLSGLESVNVMSLLFCLLYAIIADVKGNGNELKLFIVYYFVFMNIFVNSCFFKFLFVSLTFS